MKMSVNEKPLVSIVMRIYYRGEMLAPVLEALKKLNYPSKRIELILVVDPGDFEARRIINEYIRREEFYGVKVIEMPENNVSMARNIGIRESRGEYIVVMDDDVIIHPETVNTALKILEADPRAGAVVYPVVSDNPHLSEKLHHWKYYGTVSNNVMTVMPITVFRRNVLEKVGGYREDMGPPLTIHEDWELGSRIVRKGFKIIAAGILEQKHLKGSVGGNKRIKESGGLAHILASYPASYIRGRWRTLIEVLKSSPPRQLLEYILYVFIPIIGFVLIVLGEWMLLLYYILILSSTVVSYSFANKYYSRLRLWERIFYPLLVLVSRIVRVYLTLVGYLVYLLWKKYRKQ